MPIRQGAEDVLEWLGGVVALSLGASVSTSQTVARCLAFLGYSSDMEISRTRAERRPARMRSSASLCHFRRPVLRAPRWYLLPVRPLGRGFLYEGRRPVERVESLAAIGALCVEQEDTVAATGELVACQLYELVLDVGDDERRARNRWNRRRTKANGSRVSTGNGFCPTLWPRKRKPSSSARTGNKACRAIW